VLRTAYDAGAEVVALCDTNGGMLPAGSPTSWTTCSAPPGVRVGIHCHNDTGCAVANTLAAVDAGATHVQGTLNGYGERTGNADLVTVVANLELKLGRSVLPEGRSARRPGRARGRGRHQLPAPPRVSPTSGVSAFAHKAGLHASAIKVDPNLYHTWIPRVSQRHASAGLRHGGGRVHRAEGSRAGLRALRDASWSPVTAGSRRWSRGYTFEAADASFELLLRGVEGPRRRTSTSSRGA
jgi:2-isopropylmalate synthase